MNINLYKPRRLWVLATVFPALAIIALNYYLQWPTNITHRFLLVAANLVLVIPGSKLFSTRDKHLFTWALVTGFLFVIAQVAGERLSMIGTLAESDHVGWDLLLLTVSTLGLAPAAGGMFAWLCECIQRTWDKPFSSTKTYRYSHSTVFLFSTVILLLCWLPYFMAFYPGLFTYDISYQYLMYKTGEYSTHHPLLHTLMVGFCCDIGRLLFGYPVKGILLYTVIQMVLMAAAMSSAISFLYRHGTPLWFCIVLLVFDAVMPFNTLMVISSTKDTLFAGCVLYLLVMIFELVDDPAILKKPSWMIRFVLIQVAVGLMRNNGFICLIGVLIVSVVGLLHYRTTAMRMIALCLCSIILYSACNAGLKAAVNAKDGSISEALSVPIQQLSRVYVMTDDEAKPEILKWLPLAGEYANSISDMVKKSSTVTVEQLPQFLKLWLDVGLRHPIIYLDAFGHLTKGFYQLDEEPPQGGQYLETKFHESVEDMILPNSQWPWLRDLMSALYSNRGYLDIPLYSAILSHAFWCWVMLFAFMGSICLRRKDVFIAGVIPFALFLSILLGPCVMLRYIYPIIITGPVLIGVLLIAPASRSNTAAMCP